MCSTRQAIRKVKALTLYEVAWLCIGFGIGSLIGHAAGYLKAETVYKGKGVKK